VCLSTKGSRGTFGDILYSNDSVNGNWTYTYDDMNRLTQGVCTANCPAAQGMTYAYDRFGNRWGETLTAGSGIQPQYNFNANNQIDISGVLYDAAGNVTNGGYGIGNTYTYDAENRIITVGGWPRLLISLASAIQWVPRPSRTLRRAGGANACRDGLMPPDPETKSSSNPHSRAPAQLRRRDRNDNCSSAIARATPPVHASPGCDGYI
jgi:hypothetical protein